MATQIGLWQVQVLDDEATARGGYAVYRVVAELDWYNADGWRAVLKKQGYLARIVEVKALDNPDTFVHDK